MTRKNYIALAKAIATEMQRLTWEEAGGAICMVELIVGEMQRDNPAFARKKFLQAALGANERWQTLSR